MEDSECESHLFSALLTAPLCVLITLSIAVATARLLTQALSNTVTANDALVARLWETYMNLPEDQVVLMFVSFSPCEDLHKWLTHRNAS